MCVTQLLHAYKHNICITAAPRNEWLGISQFTPLKDPYYFRDKQHIASQRVGFIEIQAPILDTQFFSWFLSEVSTVIIHSYQLHIYIYIYIYAYVCLYQQFVLYAAACL
jgi:hypothetical protein